MIAFTSRLALKAQLPLLSGQRARVYQLIYESEHPGLCIAELAVAARCKEGAICGRIQELRAMECIMDGPVKVSPLTGMTVKTYIAVGWSAEEPEPKQGTLPLA